MCSNWAAGAGVASTGLRRPSAKQFHYLRLRQEGAGRRDSALFVLNSNGIFVAAYGQFFMAAK